MPHISPAAWRIPTSAGRRPTMSQDACASANTGPKFGHKAAPTPGPMLETKPGPKPGPIRDPKRAQFGSIFFASNTSQFTVRASGKNLGPGPISKLFSNFTTDFTHFGLGLGALFSNLGPHRPPTPSMQRSDGPPPRSEERAAHDLQLAPCRPHAHDLTTSFEQAAPGLTVELRKLVGRRPLGCPRTESLSRVLERQVKPILHRNAP